MARKKGQGSISKRLDGSYMGRISKNGNTKYFYGKTESEVQLAIDDYKMKIASGNFCFITLSAYMHNFLVVYKMPAVKPSTYDTHEKIWRLYIDGSELGKTSMCDLTTDSIQLYLNALPATGLSYSQCKKIQELISMTLKHAFFNRDITSDIASMVSLPRRDKFPDAKVVQAYTQEEYIAVKKVCDTKYYDSGLKSNLFSWRYAPLIIFLFNTGLRCGELLALRWENIDLDAKVIHVCENAVRVKSRSVDGAVIGSGVVVSSPKTKKSIRDVPLNDVALSALLETKKRYQDCGCLCEYVACNMDGGMLNLRSFERMVEKTCQCANVPYKGVHAIRHTFTSFSINAGIPPQVVSDLLGHSSVVFTLNRYNHNNEDSLRHAVDLLQHATQI